MEVKLELTKDWLHLKKGDIIERSKDVARLHTNVLKNAKVWTKPKKATKKKKKFPDMSGDGKVTMKDVLMARGVIKKKNSKKSRKLNNELRFILHQFSFINFS